MESNSFTSPFPCMSGTERRTFVGKLKCAPHVCIQTGAPQLIVKRKEKKIQLPCMLHMSHTGYFKRGLLWRVTGDKQGVHIYVKCLWTLKEPETYDKSQLDIAAPSGSLCCCCFKDSPCWGIPKEAAMFSKVHPLNMVKRKISKDWHTGTACYKTPQQTEELNTINSLLPIETTETYHQLPTAHSG